MKIILITSADRKRSKALTKGKKYKLVSPTTGRVFGYAATKDELKRRRGGLTFLKKARNLPVEHKI